MLKLNKIALWASFDLWAVSFRPYLHLIFVASHSNKEYKQTEQFT